MAFTMAVPRLRFLSSNATKKLNTRITGTLYSRSPKDFTNSWGYSLFLSNASWKFSQPTKDIL